MLSDPGASQLLWKLTLELPFETGGEALLFPSRVLPFAVGNQLAGEGTPALCVAVPIPFVANQVFPLA